MPEQESIDAYIRDRPKPVATLLTELRAFIKAALPGVTEGMKYGAPVFYNAKKTPVIYLFGSRDHVNFGFLKSSALSDPNGVLLGSGKPSKHIEIHPDKPINKPALREFIKQCETLEP